MHTIDTSTSTSMSTANIADEVKKAMDTDPTETEEAWNSCGDGTRMAQSMGALYRAGRISRRTLVAAAAASAAAAAARETDSQFRDLLLREVDVLVRWSRADCASCAVDRALNRIHALDYERRRAQHGGSERTWAAVRAVTKALASAVNGWSRYVAEDLTDTAANAIVAGVTREDLADAIREAVLWLAIAEEIREADRCQPGYCAPRPAR